MNRRPKPRHDLTQHDSKQQARVGPSRESSRAWITFSGPQQIIFRRCCVYYRSYLFIIIQRTTIRYHIEHHLITCINEYVEEGRLNTCPTNKKRRAQNGCSANSLSKKRLNDLPGKKKAYWRFCAHENMNAHTNNHVQFHASHEASRVDRSPTSIARVGNC